MKIICFFLLLVGFNGWAQTKSPNYAIDGRYTCLHYDTAEVNGPVTVKEDMSEEEILGTVKDDIRYRGNVEFKIGFTSIKCFEATTNETNQSLTAKQVYISCLYYPLLKGDQLTYSKDKKQAVLTGHIIIQEKGVEKALGNSALLDLSHERYVVSNIK